jgi:BNR repeat-like domain
MPVILQSRWRLSIPIAFVLLALIVSLAFTLLSRGLTHAAGLTQISSDPFTNATSNHKTEVEPDTFAFGTTVVSVFQQGRFFDGGGSDIGLATSTNGGTTFIHGSLPGTTPFSTPTGIWQRTSDASVAFDAKHNVWITSFLGLFPNGNTNEVDVLASRSTDGGLHWSNPVVVNASGDFNDKNWTVCDDTPTSPFFGNCYTEFDDFTKLNLFSMSTSTDGGMTWGAAQTDPNHTCVIGGQPVVQPNGTVVVPIDDCLETEILSIRSTDGGNTWSKPVLAAQLLNDGHPGNIRSPDLPSAEIDSSGRVYVVWTDCRTENFCNSGNNDLLLITSDDGITWSAPARIPTSNVGSGIDILIPGLAVDRNTSGSSAHLAVEYYTFPSINCTATGTRNTPACQLNVGFLSSTDGGAHWSLPQQLAGPMTLTWLPLTTQGFMVADYLSTSIVPGATDATPVFEVAFKPTIGKTCSNIQTGAPGSHCNQPTFTSLQGLGGTIAATSAPTNTNINPKQHLHSRQNLQ